MESNIPNSVIEAKVQEVAHSREANHHRINRAVLLVIAIILIFAFYVQMQIVRTYLTNSSKQDEKYSSKIGFLESMNKYFYEHLLGQPDSKLDITDASTQTISKEQLILANKQIDARVSQLLQAGVNVSNTGINYKYDSTKNIISSTVELGDFTTSNLKEGDNLYFTNGRVYSALRTQSPLALSSSGTLSIQQASSTTNGYISSDDFKTFSDKEGPLSFSTGLSRTDDTVTNTLAVGKSGGQSIFGGTEARDTLTLNSTTNDTRGGIYLNPNGGNVGIGTTNPQHTLSVNGTINASSTVSAPVLNPTTQITFPDGTIQTTAATGGSSTINTGAAGYFGYYPAAGTTIDDQAVLYTNGTNVGIGTTSPASPLDVVGGINTTVTSGIGLVSVATTGYGVQGISDSAYGMYGISNTGTAIYGQGSTSATGVRGSSDSGTGGIFLSNTGIGASVSSNGGSALTATSATATGAVISSTSGVGATISSTSGYGLLVPAGNVGIGVATPTQKLDILGSINISSQYQISGNAVLSLGSLSSRNTFVGISTNNGTLSGGDNVFVGNGAGASTTSGSNNSFFGSGAGASVTSGTQNSFFGYGAGNSASTQIGNSFFGHNAGNLTVSNGNAFFGRFAGPVNTTGANNTFIGESSGTLNQTGSDNTFVGGGAGQAVVSASSNTMIGQRAGDQTTGAQNVMIGASAGNSNTTGSNNVFIGYNTTAGSGGLTNAIAIGANTNVTQSNSIILGSNNNVGIGVSNPSSALHVSLGNVQVDNLTAAAATQVCRDGSNRLSTCSSSQQFKQDITYLSNADYQKFLQDIISTDVATFEYKTDHPDQKRLGIIAEKAPSFLQYVDEHGNNNIDFYSYQGGYSWAGIKALAMNLNDVNIRIDPLATDLTSLKNKVASLTTELESIPEDTDVTQVASFSATLSQLTTKVDLLSEELANVKGQVLGASVSATLSQADSILAPDTTATLAALTVSGKTVLNDLGVAGLFTDGLLTFDGINGTVNALSGPLKIQSLALGDVDLQGGKIEMDTKGNVKVNEGVIYGNDTFRGRVALKAGETEIKVDKTWGTVPVTVNVSTFYDTKIWIQDLTEKGFTIKVDTAPSKDTDVNWIAFW